MSSRLGKAIDEILESCCEKATMKKFHTIFLTIFTSLLFNLPTAPAANLDAEVSHFAGAGGAGFNDGTKETAKFFNPIDVAIDSSGVVYILDAYSLRRIENDNSVKTIWKQSTNSDWLCSMAIDKNDVFWIVNCGAFNVFRVSKSGQQVGNVSLPQRSGWGNGMITGIDFLPSGNLLIPTITSGVVLQVTPGGVVSVYKQYAENGACSNNKQASGSDICPFSLAVSTNGEVLMTAITSSGNKNFRVEGDRSLSQIFSVRDPRAVRFTNNAFYVQNYGWEGNCSKTFSKIYRLTGDFSSTEVASVTAPAWINTGFAILSSRYLFMPVSPAHYVSRIDLNDGSALKIGNSDLGCRSGSANGSSFFQPSGLVEDSDGTVYLKDDWSIRKITTTGEVSTVFLSQDWLPRGRLFLQRGQLIFIDNQKWVNTLSTSGGTPSRKYLYTVTGDGPQYNGKSMAIDPDGNIYMILNKNEDWTNKFLRKIETNGNLTDYTDLNLGNSDVGIEVDGKGILYLGVNGQIRRYSNIATRSFSVAGSYYGSLVSIRVATDGTIYTLSESYPTLLLNRYRDSVVDNVIQGANQGSVNNGRNSSFWNVDDLLVRRNGDILFSENTNNVVRRVVVKGISTATPIATPSVSDQPIASPTPTPFVTPTPLPTPSSESKPKPEKPTFKGVNFVGNKLNIEINLGSSASQRPDKVYLVAPKLGINLANPLSGAIAGSVATWSLDFDKALGGSQLPLEIISERDGVRGESLMGNYQIPAIIDSTKATSVPLAPKNFKSRIIGNSAVITVEATAKSGALATNGYLFGKSLGISKSKAIEGDVVGEKVILEVPIKASMMGKRFPITIYLTNQKGESKPLSATLSIPAAPKVPTLPTALPTPKAPKTVICVRSNQTRAFEGTQCPPGWEKR